MVKKRIYTIAKENSVENQVVLDAAAKLGIDVKNHMSSVDESVEKKIVSSLKGGKKPVNQSKAQPKTDEKREGSNHNSGDHKTKIKITAVRRDTNKGKGHFDHRNNNHNSNSNHPNSNNSNYHRPNNGNNSHNSNNANNGNRNDNRNSQNRDNRNRNNETRNNRNGENRNNNNNRNRNNNNRRDRSNVQAQAPRPRQSAGNKYLEQFKTNIADASRIPSHPTRNHNNRSNNNRTNNSDNAHRNNHRPNNNNENNSRYNKNNNNHNVNNRNNNNNHNNQNQNRRPNNNNAAAKAKETPKSTVANVNIPKPEYKKPKPTNNNRDFGHKQNLANPFGSRKKKKERKRQQRQRTEPKKPMPQRKERPLPETLVYTVGMNAQDIGKLIHREPAEIVKKLFMLGIMINQNKSLDKDTIELLAEDYGIKSEEKVQEDVADIDKYFDAEVNTTENLVTRPPVVTIMGHVDHGKTTLLDHLRHTHVTAGEAGGITQHIGAYQVRLKDRLITFLDTPGHAAFTNMRARGADITDIVILVVAADDGVMPQTIEAINHAKAANDPIIVAINKIDKPGANPQHVIEELMQYDLVPEDYGGDTIFVNISAKMGTNIDELLEMILLESDVLELKANPQQKAIGTVIEAKLDKGRGPVATLLVQQGTLHVGDPIVVGNTFGRVRTMTNYNGKDIKNAKPSEPVEITGLNDVPESADKFVVFDDEKTARAAGE